MDEERLIQLEDVLVESFVAFQTASFNRAMNALREAGAIDDTEMRREYKGIGSKYYDLVTESFEFTTKFARPQIKKILTEQLVD